MLHEDCMRVNLEFNARYSKVAKYLQSQPCIRRESSWIGDGRRCEELPATFVKDKKIIIKLVPWCYIYNLVGYVLHYLNTLHSTGLLTDPHLYRLMKFF